MDKEERQTPGSEAEGPAFEAVLAGRRSIRRYRDVPVADATLAAVMEVAGAAPSAKNEQTCRVIAVRDAALRARLAAACGAQRWVAGAPVLLVAYTQNPRVMACGQSAGVVDSVIVMSYMQLKAAGLGLGTCWLGGFDAVAAHAALGLPADATVVAMSALGWPDEAPQKPRRKPAAELYEVR